jgi:hypothetical protein
MLESPGQSDSNNDNLLVNLSLNDNTNNLLLKVVLRPIRC